MTFRSSGAFRKRRHRLSWGRRRRILLLEFLGREESLERVAAAIALGVALGFSPFLGFHLLLALGLATILKLNRLDAALGTFVGNPWTFPPVFALGYRLGRVLLHHDPHRTPPMNWHALLHSDIVWVFHPVQTVRMVFGPRAFMPRLYAFLLGTTILAVLIGAATYFVALWALRLYHRRHPAVAARAARRRSAERIPRADVAMLDPHSSDSDSSHLVN